MPVTTLSVVIVLRPPGVPTSDALRRFLGLVLTPGGNYPCTRVERIEYAQDTCAQIRACGPRVELDRLAYALKATFRLESAELVVVPR